MWARSGPLGADDHGLLAAMSEHSTVYATVLVHLDRRPVIALREGQDRRHAPTMAGRVEPLRALGHPNVLLQFPLVRCPACGGRFGPLSVAGFGPS